MSRSVSAIVRPEMLVWARRSAGYGIEAVAKKVGVKTEQVSSWESGEARPTIRQLRNLADMYKRPIAVFYLPEPPRGFQAMKDFRRPRIVESGTMSPALTLSIRLAQERRQIAVELADLVELDVGSLSIAATVSEDPELLGSRIRTFLGVSIDDQCSWVHGRVSFNRWRSVFESAGILVFQIYDVAASEVSGYSLNHGRMPVVAVNVKDHYNRRIFTLFHELAHILIHSTGLCDLTEPFSKSIEGDEIEAFCNRVAGACLVPVPAIHRDQLVRGHSANAVWTDREIGGLARRFGVSREAMVRRLVFAGLSGEEFYRLKRDEYRLEYETSSRRKSGGGRPPAEIMTLSSLGRMFVALVVQNLQRDNITASTASDYLDMKLDRVAKLEVALNSSDSRY